MRYIKAIPQKTSYQLKLAECDIPTPGEHDVLIKVAASGVNRADIYQAEGNYPPPQGVSEILGLEVSGEIVEIGTAVKTHAVGDKVCALLQGGGYAEYVAVPEWRVLPVPKSMEMVEAAAIPETFFTAYWNLFDHAALSPSESVLIHGGAGGVGSAAIQLAKVFGSTVYATAGSKRKRQLCVTLGSDFAIDYSKKDFVEEIKKTTDGQGVDVVLDMVGGEYFQRNMKVLCYKGRLLSLAFLHGAKAEINFAPLLMKNLTIIGSTLRSQDEETIYDLAQSMRSTVWPLLEDRTIYPVMDHVFKADEAQEAHDRMLNFEHAGKMVLQW